MCDHAALAADCHGKGQEDAIEDVTKWLMLEGADDLVRKLEDGTWHDLTKEGVGATQISAPPTPTEVDSEEFAMPEMEPWPIPKHVAPTEVAPVATYPCLRCGASRTRDEGGTVFTVCDACYNKVPTEVAPKPRPVPWMSPCGKWIDDNRHEDTCAACKALEPTTTPEPRPDDICARPKCLSPRHYNIHDPERGGHVFVEPRAQCAACFGLGAFDAKGTPVALGAHNSDMACGRCRG